MENVHLQLAMVFIISTLHTKQLDEEQQGYETCLIPQSWQEAELQSA